MKDTFEIIWSKRAFNTSINQPTIEYGVKKDNSKS